MSGEVTRVSDEIANILRDTDLSNGECIAVLEMLKTDILLNSGMVTVDGEALTKQ